MSKPRLLFITRVWPDFTGTGTAMRCGVMLEALAAWVLLWQPSWLLVWLAAAAAVLLGSVGWRIRKKSRHCLTLAGYALYELARSAAVQTGQAWYLWDRVRGRERWPVDWR